MVMHVKSIHIGCSEQVYELLNHRSTRNQYKRTQYNSRTSKKVGNRI